MVYRYIDDSKIVDTLVFKRLLRDEQWPLTNWRIPFGNEYLSTFN